MRDERKIFRCQRQRLFVALIIWLVLAVAAAVAWRYVVVPLLNEDLATDTSAAGDFEHDLTINLDGFSGYALWRSPLLARDLAQSGIRLTAEDDGADYPARIEALEKGKCQFAVFTIDAYLAAGADAGLFPGSIVMVIDETKGADAIVSYESGVPDLSALNNANGQIIATGHSPSEFLSRVLVAHFQLPELQEKWLKRADSVEDVYEQFKTADKNAPTAFALWEPYVARAKAQDGVKVLVDSSRLKGYIVDVLVVERRFLRDQPQVVQQVLESYLRTAYAHQQQTNGYQKLVQEDAERSAAPLSAEQAQAIVNGIAWANTLDNYTYFGLEQQASSAIRHIEDSIRVISDVLVATGRVDKNPTEGKPERLYYAGILSELRDKSFHPGMAAGALPVLDAAAMLPEEQRRSDITVSSLSDQQWEELRPIGELRVEPIAFGRGGARLTRQAERDLQALVKRLEDWPHSYCLIRGHTRPEGDADANKRLAQQRAEAVAAFLQDHGIASQRVHVRAQPGSGAQAVSFILGEPAY